MTRFNPKLHRHDPRRAGMMDADLLKSKELKAEALKFMPDLRWQVRLPLQERHSFLRRIEGWYKTEQAPFENWCLGQIKKLRAQAWISPLDNEVISRYSDLYAAYQLYQEAKGNKKAFPRWCNQNGLWRIEFELLYKKYVEESAPTSFKISCRFDDFRRAGTSPHFGSCMTDAVSPMINNLGIASKYIAMADPNVFVVFVLDASGEIKWRTWGMLMATPKGYGLMLFRAYGNGPSTAIAKKLSELAHVYVDCSYADHTKQSVGFVTRFEVPLDDRRSIQPAINATPHILQCVKELIKERWHMKIVPDMTVPYQIPKWLSANDLPTLALMEHPYYEAILWFRKEPPKTPLQAKTAVPSASQSTPRGQTWTHQAQEGVEQ